MIQVPGYRTLSTIFENDTSLVLRGQRLPDGLPVVLKILKDDHPSAEKLRRTRQEHRITQTLGHLPGVITTYDLLTFGNTLVIVLEDFAAEAVSVWMATQQNIPLEKKLSLAIKMAACLGEIHIAHIIHKDINLSNFVYNPVEDKLKLIDFGISTSLSQETPEFMSPAVLEGTLPYISPEQTGRMNRAVDYRTDYYSLGVTLYELFTGRLPFEAKEPMELIHCHIARQPPPPSEVDSQVPEVLSDIVLKLMAKIPEERYRSSMGIQADLERCLCQVTSLAPLSRFPLGAKDQTERLVIPQKLYGREREVQKLEEGFQRVSQGQKEMMLVSGQSGIGKTALVQEVYRPLTMRCGYFICGKFDQLQRNTPYSAIVNALQQLVRQLVTEPEARIQSWKGKILKSLGQHAGIIIELIPEMTWIVGPQPPIDPLPPMESQNRFNLVIQRFIGALARPEHPLVLFLDDLQWADIASLQLLQLMMGSPEIEHFYLIGAYRDSEIGMGHPLVLILEEIQRARGKLDRISLAPLNLAEVNRLVSEALFCGDDQARPLADLLRNKTNGNPFFLKEFLNALVEKGMMVFDPYSGGWRWDLDAIQSQGITDNVADLLVERIQRLTPDSQQMLRIAACIGNQFDLNTVAIVSNKSLGATIDALFPAAESGLVIPLGHTRRFGVTEAAEDPKIQYKFSHDRIQQVTYSLIPAHDKPKIHLCIGRLLLQNNPLDGADPTIFDVVNQLKCSIEILETQQERDEVAELNLRAGKKAKLSAAHNQAFRYLFTGLELVGAAGWTRRYELTLSLTEEAAEAAQLTTDFEAMKKWTDEILVHAKTLLDKVKAYEIRIIAYSAQRQLHEAIRVALTLLVQLGVPFPEKPGTAPVVLGLLKTKLALAGKNITKLAALPEMTDSHRLATIRIIRSLNFAAYLNNPNLSALTTCKLMRMLIRYGNNSWSASIFASYGVILCGWVGDIDNGYQLGLLALQLLGRRDVEETKCLTTLTVHCFIRHWKEHLSNTLEPLKAGYQIGLDTGSLEWTAFCVHIYCQHAFFVSQELSTLGREMAFYSEAIDKLHQKPQLGYNEMFRQLVLNLTGHAANPVLLVGEAFDESKSLAALQEANEKLGIYACLLLKMILCCTFEQYQQAIEHSTSIEAVLDTGFGCFAITRYHFYDSLARLKVIRDVSARERRSTLKRVRHNQQKLRKWAAHAPMNHRHCYLLVEAERHRVSGDAARAADCYSSAIALARTNRYLHEEALALELAGQFYLSRNDGIIGMALLQEAHYSYLRWGAMAKVQHMEKTYHQTLLRPRAAAGKSPGSVKSYTSQTMTPSTMSSEASTENLDFESIIKASQSISSQIVLSDLLDNLLKTVLENAGAERGALVFEDEGHLWVEARLNLGPDSKVQLNRVPLERCEELGSAIIRYVFRTRENVVLGDAATESKFAQDAYVLLHQPRSVLCLPIQQHNKVVGVLYLENNQTTDAFTPDRVRVLGVLATQAAISVDKAKLYKRLEKALDQAEESARTKSEFLAKTSHELRTPLNAIINLPQGIRLRFIRNERAVQCSACLTSFELDPDEQVSLDMICPACQQRGALGAIEEYTLEGSSKAVVQALEVVERNGRYLLAIVEDLLAVSDISRGDCAMEHTRVNLGELLREVEHAARPQAQQRGIELSLSGDSEETFLKADREKLHQVFKNLINNAIKFSRVGGKVAVLGEPDKDKVLITVEDQGIGIAPEHQELIFQGFRQASGGATRSHGGMGLGLAVAKNYVEMHGGTIWVESELGKGSKFHVQLPRWGRDN